MCGHIRMALTHIYHHDQPLRLGGMNPPRGGLSALSSRPGALLYSTVHMCNKRHGVDRPSSANTTHSQSPHTHTRRILHPARTPTPGFQASFLTNASSLGILGGTVATPGRPMAPGRFPRPSQPPSPVLCVIVPCGYVRSYTAETSQSC